MGIYKDWQIHTKTSFRPIQLQESWSGPHTNPTPSNNHGRRSWGAVAKFLQNLPFLPQILAFLCLKPPDVPVSPHTFKFTPPAMITTYINKVFLSLTFPLVLFLSTTSN